MNEHQQILWRNVRYPTVSKQTCPVLIGDAINTWFLVTSVSQSFMRLCAGFCAIIFACNQEISHFKPGVLLVNRCVTSLQASQMLTTGLRMRFEQLSHSFYDKEGEKIMLSYFPPSPLFLCTPLSFVYEYFDRWIDLLNLSLFVLHILILTDQYNQKAIYGFMLNSCVHSWNSLVPVDQMWGISGWQSSARGWNRVVTLTLRRTSGL